MEEELGLKNIDLCSAPILESVMKISNKPDKKDERFRLLSKTLDQTDTFAVVVPKVAREAYAEGVQGVEGHLAAMIIWAFGLGWDARGASDDLMRAIFGE